MHAYPSQPLCGEKTWCVELEPLLPGLVLAVEPSAQAAQLSQLSLLVPGLAQEVGQGEQAILQATLVGKGY